MKKILGIFRGFPGLGRVVSGVSLLEILRDEYGYSIDIISYLQGNRYLELKGYENLHEVGSMDYCSIGLLPTNVMGAHIHEKMRSFLPDIVIIDGEPLIIQALRISYPKLKIVVLLNPSDVDNEQNDQEAMRYFNAMYSLSDLAIVHGLRGVSNIGGYKKLISINTILRREVLAAYTNCTNNIFCILGGGTVNVGSSFSESTIRIAKLCIGASEYLNEYTIHIVCSSKNIYDALNKLKHKENIILHDRILDTQEYYSKARLIITRSGRNTLSELAYLGIPALSFLSGCQYRRLEQKQNMEALATYNIKPVSLDIKPNKFAELIKETASINYQREVFIPGNHQAIQEILNL